MSKGDKTRIHNRQQYSDNWSSIYGKKREKNDAQLAHEEKVFGAFENDKWGDRLGIDKKVTVPSWYGDTMGVSIAMKELVENYGETLASLDDGYSFDYEHGSFQPGGKHTERPSEYSRKLTEHGIMYQYLMNIEAYADPVATGKEIFKRIQK